MWYVSENIFGINKTPLNCKKREQQKLKSHCVGKRDRLVMAQCVFGPRWDQTQTEWRRTMSWCQGHQHKGNESMPGHNKASSLLKPLYR